MIVSIELRHAAESIGLDLVDSSSVRQLSTSKSLPSSISSSSMWRPEFATFISLRECEGWLLGVYVAAKVSAANRPSKGVHNGVRFLWPPVYEVVPALSGLQGSRRNMSVSYFGPFRSIIHVDANAARPLSGEKRKRSDRKDNILHLSNSTQIWKPGLTGIIGNKACESVLQEGKTIAENSIA